MNYKILILAVVSMTVLGLIFVGNRLNYDKDDETKIFDLQCMDVRLDYVGESDKAPTNRERIPVFISDSNITCDGVPYLYQNFSVFCESCVRSTFTAKSIFEVGNYEVQNPKDNVTCIYSTTNKDYVCIVLHGGLDD